jgi:hypothetical protein
LIIREMVGVIEEEKGSGEEKQNKGKEKRIDDIEGPSLRFPSFVLIYGCMIFHGESTDKKRKNHWGGPSLS